MPKDARTLQIVSNTEHVYINAPGLRALARESLGEPTELNEGAELSHGE